MPLRFGLILATFLIVGSPARATAQSSASAAVRATVRPGKCPVHSNCGGNPVNGPKEEKQNQSGGPAAGPASLGISLVELHVGAPTEPRPVRIVLRSPDDRPTASSRGPDLPLVLHEVRPEGLWLYGLPQSVSLRGGASRAPVTVVVEY